MKMRLGIIGAGNMSGAILHGVLRSGIQNADSIWLSNPSAAKLEPFKTLGVNTTQDNLLVASKTDVIVLGVKPQVLPTVLDEIGDMLTQKCVVSIAAGISASFIQARAPGAQVVCAMPNTPLVVSQGVTALSIPRELDQNVADFVREIFSAAGTVYEFPEELLQTTIAVSGSTPAFFFRLAGVIAETAAELGCPRETALSMVARTLIGAGTMLLESGKTDEELIRQVCSPGGATLAGLTAFDELNFDDLIAEAMHRCLNRAQELGK